MLLRGFALPLPLVTTNLLCDGGFGSGLLPQDFVTPYLPRNPLFVFVSISVAKWRVVRRVVGVRAERCPVMGGSVLLGQK